MTPKRPYLKPILLFVPVAFILVGGCSLFCFRSINGDRESAGWPDRGEKPEVTVSPEQIQKLATADNEFAFKLYPKLLEAGAGKNLFISPASISMMLAMAYNGAGGETKKEMAEVLCLEGWSLEELNEASFGLMVELEWADDRTRLEIANSLWADESASLKPEFVSRVEPAFDAEVRCVDFGAAETVDAINGWVAEKTNGKISGILDRIPPIAVAYLINALYFKGIWRFEFDEDDTEEQPFTLANGTTKDVPMMCIKGIYAYAETEKYQAIAMPYGDGRLAMYVVLPTQASSLAEFHQGLDVAAWQTMLDSLGPFEGWLSLPRFKLEYDVELSETLSALGMVDAFSAPSADFSNLTDDATFITEVRHKTFVEVNESGTEAAATSSGGWGCSVKLSSFTLTVDRPFFCAIRDVKTGTILFMGAIYDPS